MPLFFEGLGRDTCLLNARSVGLNFLKSILLFSMSDGHALSPPTSPRLLLSRLKHHHFFHFLDLICRHCSLVLRPPKKKGLKKRARRAVVLAKKSFDISKV